MLEKFETHNDGFIKTEGTSFKDSMEVLYPVLCDVFGEPSACDTGAYWGIRFPDGELATIYNYTGYKDAATVVWNIGGNDSVVASRIKRLI